MKRLTGPAVLLGLALAGCGRHGGAPTPSHATVLCETTDVEADLGFSRERRAAAEEWAREAIHRPGSSFVVVALGEGRDTTRQRFIAQVPRTWGRNVLTAQAAFRRIVSERAGAPRLPQTEASLPADATAPDASSGGAHRVILLESGSNVTGVSRRTVLDEGGGLAPLQQSVLCDRSSSGLGLSCTAAHVEAAYAKWLPEAARNPGSSFTVHIVGTARDETLKAFQVVVPVGTLGERAAYLLGAKREIAKALDSDESPAGSAVAEALSVAASELAERQGRRTLLVLSDLRQISRRKLNFEREIPRPEVFVRWLREEGLTSDLGSIDVTVSGVHNRRGPSAPPFDARGAESLRAAWTAGFQAMGVKTPRLFSDVDAALASLDVTARVEKRGRPR